MKAIKPIGVGLPKWPALLVMGRRVTHEQAIEINFRTSSAWWSTNDREFLEFVADTIGTTVGEYGFMDFGKDIREKWGFLDLSYLENSNIMSSYIGGPHGWCSWDGVIFANSYNIGKWPSVEEVEQDWKAIAEAFPFLSLRCQLLDGENVEEGERQALVEFRVNAGEVEVFYPDEDRTPMMPTVGPDISAFMANRNSRYREHDPEHLFTQRYEIFKQIRGL